MLAADTLVKALMDSGTKGDELNRARTAAKNAGITFRAAKREAIKSNREGGFLKLTRGLLAKVFPGNAAPEPAPAASVPATLEQELKGMVASAKANPESLGTLEALIRNVEAVDPTGAILDLKTPEAREKVQAALNLAKANPSVPTAPVARVAGLAAVKATIERELITRKEQGHALLAESEKSRHQAELSRRAAPAASAEPQGPTLNREQLASLSSDERAQFTKQGGRVSNEPTKAADYSLEGLHGAALVEAHRRRSLGLPMTREHAFMQKKNTAKK